METIHSQDVITLNTSLGKKTAYLEYISLIRLEIAKTYGMLTSRL